MFNVICFAYENHSGHGSAFKNCGRCVADHADLSTGRSDLSRIAEQVPAPHRLASYHFILGLLALRQMSRLVLIYMIAHSHAEAHAN
jgi:hypothetical protein